MSEKNMPAFFIGHGSPMNAIETSQFSIAWRSIADSIEKPSAILCISAHWMTKGTQVTAMNYPRTIHDFGGFPQALFDVKYPAKGSPELAKEITEQIKTTNIKLDQGNWGLDHGSWSILRQMYPNADIPVLQLSLDYNQDAQFHYELGRELNFLRTKKVLIIGSGNIVHNLRTISWENKTGFDWAIKFDNLVKEKIKEKDHTSLINYKDLDSEALLSIPTPEHYYPLLYILGLQNDNDEISFPVEGSELGSISMTSVKVG